MRVFSSDRLFVIFSYQAGHGHLTLRSPKGAANETRLTLLFMDVRALELRCTIKGLILEQMGEASLAERYNALSSMIEPGLRIYRVTSDGWEGYILSDTFAVSEDKGGFADPAGPYW